MPFKWNIPLTENSLTSWKQLLQNLIFYNIKEKYRITDT